MKAIRNSLVAAVALASAGALATPLVQTVVGTPLGSHRVKFSYSVDAAAVMTVLFETNVAEGVWAPCDMKALFGSAASPSVSGDMNCPVDAGPHEFKLELNGGIAAGVDADAKFRARVTAHALDDKPNYMAVELSAGENGLWRVRYYDSEAELPGGVMDTAYRTTTMLFKKVYASGVTFTMGSFAEEQRSANEASHRVTMDHNYYLAVFPMTQKQCSLMYGSEWKSNFPTDGDMRIRDRIYCETYQPYARGASYYPDAPTDDSLLGKLRAMTGGTIDFDLPGEAQWEFACRAGTREVEWNDGSAILAVDYRDYATDANLPGRYKNNQKDTTTEFNTDCDTDSGTPIAGTYPPNKWGFYDMHGGVEERCLDWSQDDISALNGAINCNGLMRLDGTADAKPTQVVRGGAWSMTAQLCRTASRRYIAPGYTDDHQEVGMRVACRNGLK